VQTLPLSTAHSDFTTAQIVAINCTPKYAL